MAFLQRLNYLISFAMHLFLRIEEGNNVTCNARMTLHTLGVFGGHYCQQPYVEHTYHYQALFFLYVFCSS